MSNNHNDKISPVSSTSYITDITFYQSVDPLRALQESS